QIKVRIESLVRIVLDAVVLIAQAQIQCQPGPDLPGVVEISRPFMVAVAAAEVWRAQRRGQGAIGADNCRAGQRVVMAREFALRKSGNRKPAQVAADKIVER